MPTSPVDSGILNEVFGNVVTTSGTVIATTATVTGNTTLSGNTTLASATANNLSLSSITGPGFTGGQFTVGAAALTTVTDANITGNHTIVITPLNAAAGLLIQGKTCSVATGAGSFTFNVSATAAGAPAGTEIFSYLGISRTAV